MTVPTDKPFEFTTQPQVVTMTDSEGSESQILRVPLRDEFLIENPPNARIKVSEQMEYDALVAFNGAMGYSTRERIRAALEAALTTLGSEGGSNV